MKSGFSLVELLVVIGILLVLGGGGLVVSGQFLNRRSVGQTISSLKEAIREAELNSINGKEGSRWGVKTESDRITVFAGDSFATRNSELDEVWDLSRGVSLNDKEVVFSRWLGYPLSGGVEFQVSWEGGSQSILVNSVGGIEE